MTTAPEEPAARRRTRSQAGQNLPDLVHEIMHADTKAGAVRRLELLREQSSDLASLIDSCIVSEIFRQREGLRETQQIQEALRDEVEKRTRPPWFPGRVMSPAVDERLLVWASGGLRMVNLVDDDGEGLLPGDWVYLSGSQDAVMERVGRELMRSGATAFFDRRTPDGRLVLTYRDEEVVVVPAAGIDVEALRPGDEVRWDSHAELALEKLESKHARRFQIEDVSGLGRDLVGGQEACVDRLFGVLLTRYARPELAERYGISGASSLLLHGPPGCGKTLIARVAAAEIGRATGQRCHFFAVKPGELESAYVGETQANIRRCFRELQRAAKDGIAVLFLDEVESIGRHRGAAGAHHADRFTAAWLAELDGFANRGEVAVISATNRKDLIDSALLERLSEVTIAVPRPDARAASEIFGIHLGEKLPMRPNGAAATQTRVELIEHAITRLYAPNGGGELCTLHFRDGSPPRTIHVGELVSGRLIRQICREARDAALVRDADGGESGVGRSDMERAVASAIERMSSTLSVRNVHEYLQDLPDDADVVRVDLHQNRVHSRARYVVD